MHAGATQTFGLGSLIGPTGTVAPSLVTIEIEGRGVFAKVNLTFEFDGSGAASERLFLLEKPSDAVPSLIAVNGQSLSPESGHAGHKSVPRPQFQALEEALSVPSSHLLVLEIAPETPLTAVSLEFVVAVDLQWHRGTFFFRSPEGGRSVSFSGRWELSGLPGAGIAFAGAASQCRLETLEGARHRWSEQLAVAQEESVAIEFSLDEKKAASIAVFSPSKTAGPGCAAVAVVAPIRPQLAREPVRVAILVEVRNPQEGLLLRSMVERTVSILKPQDEFCVLLVGTGSPGVLVPWSSNEAISDETLAKLLEPTVIGRAPDMWANLQALAPHLRTSSHLLLATSGAPTYPSKGLVSNTPVFVFATGRRPFKSQLESLSQRSGGFSMEGNAETLDTLLERLRIRLSPPLLSDFKLEGWGVTELRPSGATQVYTDQPTLVFGLYEGLLPKTVTLSGQSPSRQKLAQRVKVESLDGIDLMPLYQDRVARWDGEAEPVELWTGVALARNISHAEALPAHYSPTETAPTSASAATLGLGAIGPPSISVAHSAVTLDDSSLMGPPQPDDDSFFAEDQTMRLGAPDGLIGAGDTGTGEVDLFFSEPASAADSLMGGSLKIRKAEPVAHFEEGEEADLFEDPEQLNVLARPVEENGRFQLPSGPPTIFKDDQEADVAPARPEPSEEENGARKRPASRRARPETEASPQNQVVEARPPRTPSPGWSSEWLETFLAMDPDAATAWLESCSIDHLGLATSLLEPDVVESLLARLSPLRRRAVRNQIAWGRLLDGYECEQADRQLALSLTQASL
jgi:hypothetical protein